MPTLEETPRAVPDRAAPAWPSAAIAGLLLVAALLAYHNTWSAPFVFDDRAAILDNPSIRDLGALSRVLCPPADGRAVSGRPLVNLTLAVNYRLGGTAPWGYHAFNLAVHALAGLTLFGLVRRTLVRWPAAPPRGGGTVADPAWLVTATAGVAALLWTLHPLQTESVTCIVQRTESLCGLLYLLTFYCFVRGVDSPRPWTWFGPSTAACLLGMATKEVMVTAPVLVLLYDRTFLAGSFAAAWRQRWRVHVALGASWLLLAWLVAAGSGTRGTAAGFGVGLSPWAYLLKQGEAILLYLRLTLWPHPLVVDYGPAVPQAVSELWWQGVGVLALLAGTVWALRHRPAVGFLGAWFFVILAPSSSVIPLAAQTMAEHRMYLPLAAIIAGVVIGARAMAGRGVLPGFLLLALLAGGATYRRNETYRSELTLWQDTVAHRPANPRAWLNLGNVLLEADRLPEAVAAYERAEKLQPDSPSVQANLCLAHGRLNQLPEAVAHGQAALRLDPKDANAHVNLANALVLQGRRDEAVGHYQAALRLRPDDIELLVRLTKLFLQEGDLASARRFGGEAIRLAPDNAAAQFAWGNLCVAAEDFVPAIAAYRRVVALDPGDVAARNNLANALLVTRHLPEAIAEYRTVLQLRPGDRSVQENLQLALDLQAAAR